MTEISGKNNVNFKSIALEEGQRALICGFSGSGKSTLAKYLINDFINNYVANKPPTTRGRVLIIDTKPRWRADYKINGQPAVKLYTGYSPKSDKLTGSVLIRNLDDFSLGFSSAYNGLGIYQQQFGGGIQQAGQIIRKFFETQDYKRPSLLYIDEGHDFFGSTGNSLIKPDIIGIAFRAGREKGLSTLMGVQRPVAISKLALTESNTLYSFALNSQKDRDTLELMGIPKGTQFPTQPYHFLVYKAGKGIITNNAELRINKNNNIIM